MSKEVETINRGNTLRGTLHIPQNVSGKIPIVCLYHGFCSNRIEVNFLFVKLSRLLEQVGIASIRFDFVGSGDSDGSFFDMTVSGELADAKAVLAYARSLDFVDPQRVGLLGASMGGLVAGLLAGDCREGVQALCLWAPARNMRQIYFARDTGKNDFAEIADADKAAVYAAGFRDFGGLALSTAYIKDLETIDILERSSAFHKNVLILHGDKDLAVPIANSDAYVKAYKGRAKLHVLHGWDHKFSGAECQKELFSETVSFFNQQL